MAIKECVVCGGSFDATQRTAKFCSAKCKHKEWRERNPEKMKAARKAWEKKNPDKHRRGEKIRRERFLSNHPAYKSEEGKLYRERHPEKVLTYTESKREALRTIRGIEKYGVQFLDPCFEEPRAVVKSREYTRRWKEKTGYRSPPIAPEKAKEASRKHDLNKTIALQLVKQIEKEGLSALL